jgi:arabinan endo-1,5-alpha-L-arabinosidase
VAGDNFQEGTYEIQSERSGYALELAVDFVRMDRGGRGGFGGRGAPAGPVTPIPAQELAQMSMNWPAANLDVRLGDYMFRPHQKWTVTPVANSGGYPGSSFFKITLAGTDRALAATSDGEVVAVPAFTAAPEQLWRIDQLTDGAYRIMPKAVPNSREPMALTAVGHSTPTLARFNPKTDEARWNFKKP